jgi:hypothetical protein
MWDLWLEVKCEFGKIWKVAVVARLTVLFQHFPEGLKKT